MFQPHLDTACSCNAEDNERYPPPGLVNNIVSSSYIR
jgi:hypothetical protein